MPSAACTGGIPLTIINSSENNRRRIRTLVTFNCRGMKEADSTHEFYDEKEANLRPIVAVNGLEASRGQPRVGILVSVKFDSREATVRGAPQQRRRRSPLATPAKGMDNKQGEMSAKEKPRGGDLNGTFRLCSSAGWGADFCSNTPAAILFQLSAN